MINHERWEDNEWDYSPDAHEPMGMPQEWVYTEPNEGPERRDPFAEIFTGENSLVGKVVKGIADALKGVAPPGFQGVADAFEDGQAALIGRLDLLDGVRGYAQAYMSKNVNGEWGTDNTRQLPFDAPLGPSKGAHVDAAKGGIVMDEAGLWTISLMCTARWTAYTSSWSDTDSVRVTLRVHRPDGSVYSEKMLQYLAGKSAVSPTVSVPVIVNQPGTYVTVEGYSSRWRWWDGGTRYSALAVVKHDNRVVNPGTDTVPDESR